MTPQQKYWIHVPFLLPVFPIFYRQAVKIKNAMPDLPDAQGDNFGTIDGQLPVLRIVGLGESSIAGVGCAHHKEAITGQVAHFLAQKTGRAVHFEAIGRTGITVAEALHELVPKLPAQPVDLLMVALGGNDTFQLNRPSRWRKSMLALLKAIREKQPQCAILILNLPTVWQFTNLTPLVRFVMGRLVRLHAGAIHDMPDHFEDLYYMNYPIDLYKWEEYLSKDQQFSDFFADGVHPAPITCRLWGEEIAEFIIRNDKINARLS
jgi:lysophospholipase L1-like esterase